MNTSKKYYYLLIIFIAMGFSAMISQVLLLRELVLFFTGNELTLGIILALWLFWTAFGSGIIGRLIKFSRRPENLLIFAQFLLVVLLPSTVVFIRSIKSILDIPFGEVTSPLLILLVPLLALAPVCIIVGFLFTLGCKLLSHFGVEEKSSVPGHVFLFESVGSGIAGFVASIFLFRFLENFQIVAIVCTVNLAVAVFFLFVIKRKILYLFIPLAAILIAVIIFIYPKLDDFSNHKIWGGLNLLHSETTIYGNIAVTGLGESISFYENGVLMFTHPDLMAAEESVHFALLEHPNPRKVLLIGGNPAGTLPQVLLHPNIRCVDFVLLDPTSIQLTRDFVPSVAELFEDERVTIWHKDARLFLKQTATKYDVIIVNLPDPQTAMINRFYTTEFYQSVKKILNISGILAFSTTSSENVMSEEQILFLNCLYQTMAQSFTEIVLIPGNSIHFIGCLSPEILTHDSNLLVQRLHQRNLPTVYMREYYIPFRMTTDRMDYVIEKVTTNPPGIINRDFRPIGYFYSIILWLTYFNTDLHAILNFLNRANIYILMIVSLLIICPFITLTHFSAKKHQSAKPIVLLAIMAIGFTAISLEILIILGFQAIYGYAYYQLALIMSGFMIGLTLGSWFSLNMKQSKKASFQKFINFQILLTCYPVFIAAILSLLSQNILSAFFIQIIFLLLVVGVGFIGGYQFPLANHLIFDAQKRIERSGGMLYASDLFGSVIGALITSTVLIPILGLVFTCIVFSMINFALLLILFLNKKWS